MQAGIPYCTFIVPLKVTYQTLLSLLECMAGTTGLEPATSAVTGQRSNQLSYVPSAISITYRKSQILLSFLTVHSVACFHIFYRI